MKTVKVLVHREAGTEDLQLPQYQTNGSSGMDLRCAVDGSVEIQPGETRLISAGISISIPEGFEAQVRPRSGLAIKHGLTVLNSPGTIDSDYRGLISVILHNAGKLPFTLTRGLRIAQIVFQPVVRAEFQLADDLDATARSAGGFGHTGHS